jgi:hypothetical protein
VVAQVSADHAVDVILAALRQIHAQHAFPLLSMDLDDTFLPFGAPIGIRELDLLIAYAAAGGHFVFNTLAPKEWFFLRVVEPLVRACHSQHDASLLSRVHWIVSGGREIFTFDPASRSYRRIFAASSGSKADGLSQLRSQLDPNVSLLGLYGDRFDDPQNDGNALGRADIPIVINLGADQRAGRSDAGQVFVNSAEKGPSAALRHLVTVTQQLCALGPQAIRGRECAMTNDRTIADKTWRFETAETCRNPRAVEVHGPGFVWSWSPHGTSYLAALVRSGEAYYAGLPEDITGFTFFWTGGADAASGTEPGHWEDRDFYP